jgi:thiol-disulfide isomerase/thioredoxin
MRSLVLTSFVVVALLLNAGLAPAADELNPTKAYNALVKKMRRVPRPEQATKWKEEAQAFLEEWKASGQTATGGRLYSLGQFHQAAGEYAEAVAAYRAVQADAKEKERTRDLAASSEANLLQNDELRESEGAEAIDKAVARLCAYAEEMKGDHRKKQRSTLCYLIANLHEAAGRQDAAHEMRMKIVADDPSFLGRVYGQIMRGLLGSTHALGEYDALRTKAKDVVKVLMDTQGTIVAEKTTNLENARAKLRKASPEALDDEGNLTNTDTRKMSPDERAVSNAQRSLASAESLMGRIEESLQPFELLGKPAPEWTAEKAYGDVKTIADTKGKVVMLDFWATWCLWCIKSFPAIRDLLRDYKDKGLAVVGVTVSANVVYAQRYDLDEDMASKAEGGELRYAARLASERSPADESKAIYDEEAYRAHEIEAISTFIANHEMTWPVVMIDKEEPSPKYALTGWPHAVVLDRQGRIRYFKSGALLRDDADAVAHFRKVLDDLLAEPAAR